MERKLAAVMSADMVGYSRLSERDAEGILSRQKAHFEALIGPQIDGARGRIVKTTGDGLLAEFPSAIDAVRSAIAIQTAMPGREADRDEAERIRYRIGINLGDVIVDEDDIFGDGVNVAARLQAIAEPGGICISDLVRQTILDRITTGFRSLGGQRVKNISRTIHIWEWVPDADAVTQAPEPEVHQRVRFCTSADGTQIAYAELGDGLPLLRAPHWQSHLDFELQSPVRRQTITDLAQDYRLARFDQRGNGLSDWEVEHITIDAMIEDMEAVVEATGLDRFALLGQSQGAGFAVRYAMKHPEQVACLILFGGFMVGRAIRNDADAERLHKVGLMMIREGWGLPDPVYRNFFTTNLMPGATPEIAAALNEMQRVSSAPEVAARIFDMNNNADHRDFARQVRIPTLVMHSSGDRMVPVALGRETAGLIDGAEFVELKSENHILMAGEPAYDLFMSEMRTFVEEHAST